MPITPLVIFKHFSTMRSRETERTPHLEPYFLLPIQTRSVPAMLSRHCFEFRAMSSEAKTHSIARYAATKPSRLRDKMGIRRLVNMLAVVAALLDGRLTKAITMA